MCKKPTETKEPEAKRKCFVVLYTTGKEAEEKFGLGTSNDFLPLKIFSSQSNARYYCYQMGLKKKGNDINIVLHWENDDTLLLFKFNGENYDELQSRWEIHSTEIDSDVPVDFNDPQIERENEVLRNECYRLRKELAEVTQRNAVAATYATMWDGGRDYTKERVLDNLQIVKDVLAGDHLKVRELYETWKRNEENK